jgi:hypothetical protein
MHKRSLLVLLALAWVAPLSARQVSSWTDHKAQGAECPYAKAKAAAAARARAAGRTKTMASDLPSEGSFFDVARRSLALSP